MALLAAGVLLLFGPTAADAQRRELAPDQVALLEAMRDDDLLQIRVLAAGMDLNQPLVGSLTALGFAITAGKPDVVATLLDVGTEVPPQYTEQWIALVTRNLEHGERIAELLRNARGRDAEPVPDGLDPADLPRIDGPGTYPQQHYTGPCSFESNRSRAEVTEGLRVWMRATRTLFFDAGRVPAAPARAELRAGDDRVDLGALPLGGHIRAISPTACEPVQLGRGPYTIIIETLYTESVWECNVPGCGPGRGWYRLRPVVTSVERRRIDGVVIDDAAAGHARGDEPDTAPHKPFVFDDCPCGDPEPPELHVAAAAAVPYPEPDLTVGRYGQIRAERLARQIRPDPVFCSVPVLPEVMAAEREVRELLASVQPGEAWLETPGGRAARDRVNRLVDELDLLDPSREQIRSLMFAEGLLQGLGETEGGHATEAANRAWEAIARREIQDADITEALELAAQSQLLGLDDLGDEMNAHADELVKADLAIALDLFDPCEATAEELAELMEYSARYQLFGDEDVSGLEQEYMQRVIDRLNGRPDPECPLYIVRAEVF